MEAPHGFGGRLILAASDYRRDRARWLEARRSGLGASDTAAVLGLNPYRTALDVWLDKKTGDPVEEGSDATEAGQRLESTIARWTVSKYPHLGKLIPTPGLLRHPEFHWMLATPDFGLAPRGRAGAQVSALLEVKTTSVRSYRRYWTDGNPPAMVQVQVQQQLAVTGHDMAWVACFVGGDGGPGRLMEPVPIDRNPEVIGQIIGYGGAWWMHHILEGVRPEPVFQDADKLAALFPADEALEPVTATPELDAQLATIAEARAQIRNWEAAEARAKFAVETALKGRTSIVSASGDILATWKPQTVRRLNQRKLAADHPGLIEQYKEPVTGRGALRITTLEDS
jgi:putative phage-type endonuclease